MDDIQTTYTVTPERAGVTLAALLRAHWPDQSWSALRKLIAARRVRINGSICLDSARRVKEGESVELLRQSARLEPGTRPNDLVIRHLDDHLVVVEKVSGINTVRHPLERVWNDQRRELSPTLEDLTQQSVADRFGKSKKSLARLRIVHRLDKETSGLVVFARTALAERFLGKQFHDHTVVRRYLAIVRGYLAPQKIERWLIRDRGDGRRGSGPEGVGKKAVTHIDLSERLPRHSLLTCRLETGRTHQIRIHLSEAGHPVCGEPVYNRPVGGDPVPDPDDAPRLALHAFELGFVHPESGEKLFWEMLLPLDLKRFLDRLRAE